ncbi:MAG: hypothetical protein WCX16_05565, partial [Candidatus Omnitrophota bacterium]
YANSDQQSLKEVYVWNGKAFVYSPALSTTPLIGEKQALERTWQKIKKDMQKMEGDEAAAGDQGFFNEEDAIKAWNGGSRALELFNNKKVPDAFRGQSFLH